MLKGGWWWKSCGRGLNGLYLNDPQDLTARQGKKKIGVNIGSLIVINELCVRRCDGKQYYTSRKKTVLYKVAR